MAQQPSAVRGHTGVDIGEATSAGNNPGDGSSHSSSNNDWATGVSHAHTLTGHGERADGVVEHERTVVGGVTVTAVSQSQGSGVQEHQVGRAGAGVLIKKIEMKG